MNYRIGIDVGGTQCGFCEPCMVMATVALLNETPNPSVMLLPVTSLYRVPVVYSKSTIVYTNNTYCQAMRGYGNPKVTFPIEVKRNLKKSGQSEINFDFNSVKR